MSKIFSFFPFKDIKELSITPKHEYPVANGLRGVSVFMIIFYHCLCVVQLCFKDRVNLFHSFIEKEIPGYLRFVFSFDKGVDVFFILSAYLLYSQLLIEISKTGKVSLSNFFKRRFFRIYPLFFLALVLYSIPKIDELFPNIIYNLLFINNFIRSSLIPVGWTLAFEVQFYIVLPFLAIFLAKSKQYLFPILLLLLLLSVLIRHFLFLDSPSLYHAKWLDLIFDKELMKKFKYSVYYPSHARFGLLVLGLMWAYIKHSESWSRRLRNMPRALAMLIFLIALAIFCISMCFPYYDRDAWFYENYDPRLNLWVLSLHRVLFGISLITILLLLDFKLLFKGIHYCLMKFLSLRIWRFITQLSYPMYLFHFPFIGLAFIILLGTTKPEEIETITLFQLLGAFLLSMFLLTIFSFFIHKYVEKPFLKKKKRS